MLGGARLSCFLACSLETDRAMRMEVHICICISNAAESVDTGSHHLLPVCVGSGLHTTVPLHLGLGREKEKKLSRQKDSRGNLPEAAFDRLHYMVRCRDTRSNARSCVSRGGRMCYHS